MLQIVAKRQKSRGNVVNGVERSSIARKCRKLLGRRAERLKNARESQKMNFLKVAWFQIIISKLKWISSQKLQHNGPAAEAVYDAHF